MNSYLHYSTVGVFSSAETRFQARGEAERSNSDLL
jgi:hypothetical protein